MITPGRALYLARRDFQRGLRASWHDYVTTPRIFRFRCPHLDQPLQPVPVHFLTGKDDWRLALWMLASWYRATGRNWRIVAHDDGTVPPEGVDTLLRVFPTTTIISRVDADARMAPLLAEHPACTAYRQSHPLGLKLLDVPALETEPRLILLDSDVLFFRRPDDILRWVDTPDDSSWFNRDACEASFVSPEQAREALDVDLWPRVNSGLCLLHRDSFPLAFAEVCLTRTPVLNGPIWRVEQTVLALAASRANQGGLLPGTYEVSLGPWAQPDAVARHYVGAVRQRFYAEGIARLHRELIP